MANEVEILLTGKDEASKAINNVEGSLGGLASVAGGAASTALGGISSLILGVGAAAAGVGLAGIAALGTGLGIAFSEAMGAQEILAQTEAVIRSTGSAAGMTAEEVSNLATAISLQSRFSDDAIQKGENLLLTFTNIGSEVFPGATQAMVDMAAAMGTDVASGAVQLGKALNDPIAGISALSRVGVTFTDEQKKVIEQLVATGDVAGAQQVILAELNKEFGGSAAAAAGTFAGQLDVMKNRLLNVAEAIGGPLLSVAQSLLEKFLIPALPAIELVGQGVATFLETVLGGGDLGTAFDNLAVSFYKAFGPEAGLAVMQFGNFFVDELLPRITEFVAFVQASIPVVIAVLQGLGDFIVTNVVPVFEALVAWVIANWPTIQATITTVITTVQSIVSTALSAIQGFWEANGASIMAAVSGAMAFIQSVITAVLSAVQSFWAAHGDSVMTIVNNLITIVQTNVQNFVTTLQAIITVVLDAISAFWATWGDTIMGVVDNIFETIGLAVDLFASAFEGDWTAFGETLREIWDNNWENLVAIVTTAIDAILGVDWLGLGQDIIEGIGAGITAGVSFITDAAKNAASAALEAAKAFLGIASPSKVMADLVGKPMMQGMALGITHNANLPALAAASASAGAVQSGTTIVNNLNVTGQYAYQNERTLAQDLRLQMSLMGGLA